MRSKLKHNPGRMTGAERIVVSVGQGHFVVAIPVQSVGEDIGATIEKRVQGSCRTFVIED